MHRGRAAKPFPDRLCPYCNQVLPEFRLGVRLPPGKARLFDLIQRCGELGITTADLTEITGLSARCIKSHVWQINELIADSGYRIRNRTRWVYRLVKAGPLPAARDRRGGRARRT